MTQKPATLLDYSHPPTSRVPGRRLRVALACGYAAIVALPLLIIALVGQLPHSAIVGTFLAYAFALLPTYYFDRWLLGGNGFHSPVIFALFLLFVAAMGWPLALLCARPTVWRSVRWRRIILGYAAAFVLFAIAAAWQMTRSWGSFFG